MKSPIPIPASGPYLECGCSTIGPTMPRFPLRAGGTIMWCDRVDNTQWFGVGIEQSFMSAQSAQDWLKEAVRRDSSWKAARIFFCLPFDRSQWQTRPHFHFYHGLIQLFENGESYGWRSPSLTQLFSVKPEPAYSSAPPTQVMSRQVWNDAVGKIQAAIAMGEVKKVVLARSEQCSQVVLTWEHICQRLMKHRDCFRYWFEYDSSDAVFGASPERLVKIEKGIAYVDALAGTRNRSEFIAEDERQSDELLASEKDRFEQQIVVDRIYEVLNPFGEDAPEVSALSVRKNASLQHLYREVSIRLKTEFNLDELLLALHPTPAIGGEPREVALNMIQQLESFPRGYYAGIAGWLTHDAMDCCVTIRSAMRNGNTYTLYAGAGIVAASDAAAEWEETNWKLQPMRTVLGCRP